MGRKGEGTATKGSKERKWEEGEEGRKGWVGRGGVVQTVQICCISQSSQKDTIAMCTHHMELVSGTAQLSLFET
jgi:hypothetical protein